MVLKPTPHVSGLSYDVIEWPPCAPIHPKGSAAIDLECIPAAAGVVRTSEEETSAESGVTHRQVWELHNLNFNTRATCKVWAS